MQINGLVSSILTYAPNPEMHDEVLNMRNEEHSGASRKFGDGANLMVEYNGSQLESRFMQEIQKRYAIRYERVTHHEDCEQKDLKRVRSFAEDERKKRKSKFLRLIRNGYKAWIKSMRKREGDGNE